MCVDRRPSITSFHSDSSIKEEEDSLDLSQNELIEKVLRMAKEQSQTAMLSMTQRFEEREREAEAQAEEIRKLKLELSSEQARSARLSEQLGATELVVEGLEAKCGAGEKALNGLKEHKRALNELHKEHAANTASIADLEARSDRGVASLDKRQGGLEVALPEMKKEHRKSLKELHKEMADAMEEVRMDQQRLAKGMSQSGGVSMTEMKQAIADLASDITAMTEDEHRRHRNELRQMRTAEEERLQASQEHLERLNLELLQLARRVTAAESQARDALCESEHTKFMVQQGQEPLGRAFSADRGHTPAAAVTSRLKANAPTSTKKKYKVTF